MSDDWDVDDEPVNSGSSTPAVAAIPPRPVARRFAGEDEDDDDDDWDKSDDEKKPAPAAPAAKAAAAPKKMTLKQKIAEKERLAAEGRLGGGGNDLMDEMTEQDRRRQARERELEADMAVASDLMGGSTLEDRSDAIKAALTANPKTKAEFTDLSQSIVTAVLARHATNPLFPAFIEQLAKDMCESLNAVQTRKVSSTLSVLGNTKQQDERDKASGKKKNAPAKPKLGSTKALGAGKVDTEVYDDVLDDDDFM